MRKMKLKTRIKFKTGYFKLTPFTGPKWKGEAMTHHYCENPKHVGGPCCWCVPRENCKYNSPNAGKGGR